MKKVILDTNILLAPAEHMIDIFSELKRIISEPYEILVTSSTLDELAKIGEKKSKDGRAALLGLTLIQTKLKAQPNIFEKVVGLHQTKERVRLVKSKDYADDAIATLADENYFVVTQDRELKKRVQKKGAKIITLVRQRQLAIVE